MRGSLLILIILVFVPALAVSQTDTTSPSQNNSPKTATHRNRSKITGCLTSSDSDHYLLTDQNGVKNMVYSNSVHLDSYVGQSVTLVGVQSATPTHDTHNGHAMPHFNVLEVHPSSGDCK